MKKTLLLPRNAYGIFIFISILILIFIVPSLFAYIVLTTSIPTCPAIIISLVCGGLCIKKTVKLKK